MKVTSHLGGRESVASDARNGGLVCVCHSACIFSLRAGLQQFRVSFLSPNLKFHSEFVTINWNLFCYRLNFSLSPPPLLRRFTNQEIWSNVQSGGTAAEGNLTSSHVIPKQWNDGEVVTEASQKSSLAIPEMVL
ncbi:hypothetical protein AVEN_125115-1 [Araneus ventricosus]|uniref:Uncharacterized protein n=1 Tax=Araneus ventricosus TaxID=182803 RepID=A0A4Y2FU05_ARAVE|nr:hypothetical protein AVEN_125115-1 [Araneus ventricosus]